MYNCTILHNVHVYVHVASYVIREGEPSLHLELNNGDHTWTPVHVRQFKRLTDVPAEPVSQDIPVSQLLDMDSIEYCMWGRV